MSEDPVPYEPIDLNDEAAKHRVRQNDEDPFRGRTFTALESAAFNMGHQLGMSEAGGGPSLKIEALRAAAPISAAITAATIAKWETNPSADQVNENVGINTLALAEQFLTWLEGK